MKANELNSQNNSITKKLYDLYLEFYKNENNFQNFNTNLKYKGYLIEAELIEQIKNIISYESLKAPFKNNITYENFKQKIEKSENINIPNLIKVSHFSNSKDLLQALNEDKKFYIIIYSLLKKLSDVSPFMINKKNSLSFTIENNNLLLIFNQQNEDKIYFSNKYNGLIEKSLLINNTDEENKISNNNINKNNTINKPIMSKPIMGKTKNNFYKKKMEIKPIKNTERNIQLQENLIIDIEFLLRVYFQFYNLNNIYKNSFQMKKELKYLFIKRDLIEKYKSFYENNYLENFLNSERIQQIINNTKSNIKYIHNEKVNDLIKEVIPLLPEEYKCLIQKKNINEFIKEINNIEYYTPKTLNYECPDVTNFIDCFLIRKEIIDLLINNKNEQIKNKLKNFMFKYSIIKDKSVCNYKETINIGKLNEQNIFQAEIIIKYNDQESYDEIINDLKNNSFEFFINNINITNNNIGKYKNSNNQLIILNENYLNQNKKKLPDKLNKEIQNNYNTFNTLNKKAKRPMSLNKPFLNNQLNNIKLLIYIMIDIHKIKYKIENSINNKNTQEKYCPINFSFFEQYLNKNNLLIIYQDKNLNTSIKNFDFNLTNEEIFKKLSERNVLNKFIIPNKINLEIKNIYPSKIDINNNNFIYNDFILLRKESINLLSNYSEKEYQDINYFFKDKKIYMILNKNLCIEICNMNQKNYLIPEFYFVYFNTNELKNQFSIISKIGYKNYIEKYTIFNNKEDYSSPIFINENSVIGFAYDISNINKNNQSDLIKNNILIAMIKLYFSEFNKKISSKKYYLVNTNLIKKIKSNFDFDNLINKLNEIKESKQIIELIKNNGADYNELLTLKKIYLIMKELSKEIIMKYQGKNKSNLIDDFILEESDIKVIDKTNIMYYDNFELISSDVYNLLFNKKNNDYLSKYYLDIFSTKNYLYFEIPKIINNDDTQRIIIEVGSLNENNIFIPKYILIYNSKEIYEKDINNHNKKNDSDSFFDNFNFNENNSEKLFDEQQNEIGSIYNLDTNKIKVNINIKTNFPKKLLNNININNNKYIYINEKPKPKLDMNMNNINAISPKNNFINIQNNIINVSIPQPRIFSPGNNNINNKIIYEFKNIKQEFKMPILIGLQSIGEAPIFMNSILQCFCHIEKLVNYIKYKTKVKDIIDKYKKENRINLISSFKILVDNLWPSTNRNNCLLSNNKNYYFAPYEIKEKLELMNQNFKNCIPKDLIDLILNNLHQDLNKKNQYNIKSVLLNNLDKNQVLNSYVKSFINENCSIISDIFFGIYQKCEFCSLCQTPKYEFDSFNSLYFDLWKIKSFKMENSQLNIYFSENLNLQDCFEYQRRIEYQTGNKTNFCQNCNNSNIYFKRTTIYSSPYLLIISLNLTRELQNTIKFDLWECFNLNNYVEKNKNQCFYNLIGIVAYNININHFIAYCKNTIDKNWYKYNDDIVSGININIINEINNSSFFPLILFYQNEN